ncbi:hypothetical protein OPT61_g5398 [Boeremia exigua]|uniref:Uncharacterized protein n=1 Tax=Boeremia exigua TaxID=749465 RepID=A0ACC2IAI4_9PLEO|nr:hypothetical protein OPT61_g5398 [Boeremia exigua]
MRLLICSLLLPLRLAATNAMPYPSTDDHVRNIPYKRDDVPLGEPPLERTLYIALSLVLMMILSLLLGARFSRLNHSAIVKRNFTSILVLILYVVALTFIFATSVLVAGQGLYTQRLCTSAIWTCLILYMLGKGSVYIFLMERIRVIRAPFIRRGRDRLYWSCMFAVIAGFLGCYISVLFRPLGSLRPNGRCWIGVERVVLIPLLVYDSIVDVALTGIFLYLLLPVLKLHGSDSTLNLGAGTVQASNSTRVQRSIRTLLWKSLLGTILIMFPTIANLAQVYIVHGREPAIVCLAICIIDISGDAIVLYWLTFGSIQAERDINQSAEDSMRESALRSPRPTESQEPMASEPQLFNSISSAANLKEENAVFSEDYFAVLPFASQDNGAAPIVAHAARADARQESMRVQRQAMYQDDWSLSPPLRRSLRRSGGASTNRPLQPLVTDQAVWNLLRIDQKSFEVTMPSLTAQRRAIQSFAQEILDSTEPLHQTGPLKDIPSRYNAPHALSELQNVGFSGQFRKPVSTTDQKVTGWQLEVSQPTVYRGPGQKYLGH